MSLTFSVRFDPCFRYADYSADLEENLSHVVEDEGEDDQPNEELDGATPNDLRANLVEMCRCPACGGELEGGPAVLVFNEKRLQFGLSICHRCLASDPDSSIALVNEFTKGRETEYDRYDEPELIEQGAFEALERSVGLAHGGAPPKFEAN